MTKLSDMSYTKFQWNPFSSFRDITCGRTDTQINCQVK